MTCFFQFEFEIQAFGFLSNNSWNNDCNLIIEQKKTFILD